MRATVIDSCCLINLYASQHLSEIVTASIDQAMIPKEVLDESLYVKQQCADTLDELILVEVDIAPLIAGGVLQVTAPSGTAELESFIRLAGIIDDGEAACLAIASNRDATLATDDRRAIRVASDLGVPVSTTPKLIAEWMNRTSPKRHLVTDVIRCIEQYGRFRPHPNSPDRGWWEEHRQ
ncbi:MAG: hypothetical protein IH892_12435 [Planctomycetes bacterium]|nr:hypothetical protein [Planctomycetota bacterium]MCH8217563.1 hypothetical protein [Planctomycetota bacterium]